MARNGSLLSFFKPQTKPLKRPAQAENPGEATSERRQRSKSPKIDSKDIIARHNAVKHAPAAPSVTPRPPPPQTSNSYNISDTSSLTSLSDTEPISSPTATQPLAQGEEILQHPPAAADSFVSISTMSGSSQRKIKNGEEMVIDSDEEDSDDDGLVDLDTLLSNNKPPAPRTPSTPASLSNQRQQSLSTTRNTRSNKLTFTSKPIPTVPKYKFSLDSLAAKMKKEASHDADIEVALREARVSEQTIAALGKTQPGTEINTDLLASVINDEEDPDSIERVMKAIERTEALQRKKRWRCFTEPSSEILSPNFPKLSRSPLAIMLSKPLDREAATVGGFLEEIASRGDLPDELLDFVLEAAVSERRREFHDAYCSILARRGPQLAGRLDFRFLRRWLTALGARDAVLEEEHSIEPELVEPKKAGQISEPDWTMLRNILRLLIRLAKNLQPSESSEILLVLSKISLDANASADLGTAMLLKDAFAAVADALSELEAIEVLPKFMNHIYKHVRDMQLRLQLLRAIAMPSARVCCLRRLLALAFFSESRECIQTWPGTTTSLVRVKEYLSTRSRFTIKGDMDYAWLGAAINMLDISIDDGSPPRGVDAQSEKLYNEELDKLVSVVNTMQAKIKDTGANHLARTEAKEALEVLQSRLEFSVRTRRKPRTSIFGDSERSNANIKNFFRRSIAETNGNSGST